MIGLTVTPNLELDPWDDLDIADMRHNPSGAGCVLERIGVLPGGMVSGRASVMLLIRLHDGTPVMAETSLTMFNAAARAVLASPVAEMEEL